MPACLMAGGIIDLGQLAALGFLLVYFLILNISYLISQTI